MRLDDDTVDRILAGLVDPVDAPPGYEPVVILLTAARGMPAPVPRRVAAPERRATVGRCPRLSILAAAVVLGGASGAAYAAGLPAAASSIAHPVVRSLGVASTPRTHPVPRSPQTRRTDAAARPGTTTGTEVTGA